MHMLEDIIKKDKAYYMNTFGDRLPVAFKYGRGMKLYADNDEVYYDFLGGIAVNAIGHCHPDFVAAMKDQLDKLVHTSSLYYIENQANLAKKLAENISVFIPSTSESIKLKIPRINGILSGAFQGITLW